jgi:hypothetical protein
MDSMYRKVMDIHMYVKGPAVGPSDGNPHVPRRAPITPRQGDHARKILTPDRFPRPWISSRSGVDRLTPSAAFAGPRRGSGDVRRAPCETRGSHPIAVPRKTSGHGSWAARGQRGSGIQRWQSGDGAAADGEDEGEGKGEGEGASKGDE